LRRLTHFIIKVRFDQLICIWLKSVRVNIFLFTDNPIVLKRDPLLVEHIVNRLIFALHRPGFL